MEIILVYNLINYCANLDLAKVRLRVNKYKLLCVSLLTLKLLSIDLILFINELTTGLNFASENTCLMQVL